MAQHAENKMGVMPVNKLLVNMSVPIMISMLVQAMYNIVDSIFVAMVSENALAAVSLAFPIQSLMIAVSVGTGVGINSLLSRRLGEKRYEDANAVATNGVFISLLSGLAFAVFGFFGCRIFFSAFTKDPQIIQMGVDYLSVCTIFSFGVFMQVACERIMQATGNTIYNMYTQALGAIINIIMDPILIFGWVGFPEMGVTGAAVATVFGQIVAMAVGLWLNMKKNPYIHMSFRHFKPDWRIIKEIYIVGIPSIIMQSIASVLTVGLNKILALFSTTAISVFGVYFKLQNFVFMPIFGLTNGLVPIVAFNYGAQKKQRIIDTVKLGCILSVSIMLLGTLIFQLFPRWLLLLFQASEDMLSIGMPALRIISLSFAFAGLCIVLSAVFQAMGNAVLSLILSVTRQLVVLLPVAFLFAKLWGLNALWFAFPLSECVSTVLCLFLYKRFYRSHIQTLPDVPPQLTEEELEVLIEKEECIL